MSAILVVNPNLDERKALADALAARGRQVVHAASIAEAIAAFGKHDFDQVVTVRTLPDGSGELLAQRLTEVSPHTRLTRITNFSDVRGPSDLLRFDFTDYILDVHDVAGLLSGVTRGPGPDQRALVECFTRSVEAVIGLMELTDPLTAGNAASAVRLADGVAADMGLPEERRQELALAALLHDIGNFAIRPGVLHKRDDLSPSEEEALRLHPLKGVQLLDHVEFPWKVKPIIRHHHERYDGSGYPDGKKGRAIPIGARILAVVDAYLSITGRRPHRATRGHDDALAEIRAHVGTQFDPEVVESFAAFVGRRKRLAGDVFQLKVVTLGGGEETLNRLKLLLLREEFNVVPADTAADAADIARHENARFVVGDVSGRWGEALRLLDALQDRIDQSLTDVLFLDADLSRERRVTALDNGAEEVFSREVPPADVVSRMRRILRKEEAVRRQTSQPREKDGIEGDLAEMGLTDLLQMLSMGQKTARLIVESADGTAGRLFLENGRLTHAELGDLHGADAVPKLLELRAGRFRISHGVTAAEKSIDRDAMSVLLDALRRIDEEGRGSASV
jgi:HD-GYP domain-containing protein (c-di-GMP phosphodiesterase class II)